jgi:hypothetical protein
LGVFLRILFWKAIIMSTGNAGIVQKTCHLLVCHFRNLLEYGDFGFHTRLFSHMLHPEHRFVFAGRSQAVTNDTPTHPEHVVPCATLITECQRLISEGALSDEEIAALLHKHWKVAAITKKEQQRLDYAHGFKSKMPPGWRFEDGDTFARFAVAGIVLVS